jgi:hypothetical protein
MKKLLHLQFSKLLMLLALLFGMNAVGQQTYYGMASGNYSQDFAAISGWANNYASGTGAANWRVATNVNNTTVFSTATGGGVQKGTENMVLLATGDNTGGTDLLLNFTNRNAGTISLDWAKVANSAPASNPRTSDFKIQYSVNNGTSFTDLTGYTIPRVINNTTAESGSFANIALPTEVSNKAQVVIRFYVWKNGQDAGGGNRPKFSIDNIAITSSSIGNAAPALTAVANATVDNAFTITFTDDTTWRAAITSITVGSTTLPDTAYSITSGSITFSPSASALLQTSGNKSISVLATGYTSATVTQALGFGAATKLGITTQPTAPSTNGGTLAVQPVIAVQDQYGNIVTSSTATIVAAATPETGSWTLGGTTSRNSVSGISTYSGLTASSATSIPAASITFTSGSLTSVTSAPFVVPGPPPPAPANDLCANAAAITVNAAAIQGTLQSATNTLFSNSGSKIDVWYTFTATCSGTNAISVGNFIGDVDITLFNGTCPADNNVNLGRGVSSNPTETLTVQLVAGTIYSIRVYASNTLAETSSFTVQVNTISVAPSVTAGTASAITYSTALISASASIAGCSTAITAYGIEYSTVNNFVDGAGNQVAGSNLSDSNFSVSLLNLTQNTTYYYKTFATNLSGTTYSAQGSFTTSAYFIAAPVATDATFTTAHSFTANWQGVADAESYRVDVSTLEAFGTQQSATIVENFNSGYPTVGYQTGDFQLESGTWALSAVIRATVGDETAAQLRGGDGKLTSPSINYVSSVTIAARRSTSNSTLLVQKIVNGVTTDLGTIIYNTSSPFAPTTFNVNETNPNVKIVVSNTGSAIVQVNAITFNTNNFTPSFVPNNENIQVNGLSRNVTGLLPNTTYYYRVRSENANPVAVSANSNVKSVTTGKELIWNGTQWSNGATAATPTITDSGVIEGAYNTTTNGNFSIGALTVAPSGSVNVATGTTLTVANGITNNSTLGSDGFIVRNNGAVVQNNATANTGAVKVLKNSNPLYRLDYTLWASPVNGQTLGSFSPNTLENRFYEYKYDFNGTAFSEQYFTVAPSTTFTPAKGYLIRMPNSVNVDFYNAGEAAFSFEGNFIGEMHNGPVTIPASTQGDRYTAVGNPYPSPIGVVEFFAANSAVLDPASAIYFWRKKNNAAATSYATLTLAAYTANGSTPGYVENPAIGGGSEQGVYFQGAESSWVISQGQGFIVRTSATPASTNITFNNTMRRAAPESGQAFLRTGPSQTSRLWLNLTTPNSFSQAAVAYMPNATTGLDYGYDGKQLTDNNNISLYSINSNTNLSVQARPAFTANDVVAMGFVAPAAGEYTLAIDHTDGVFNNGQNVYLKDNLTGLTQNVTNAAYTFTTQAGTFNDRFEIVYATEALGTENPLLNADSVIVYQQNGVLNITSASADITSVTLYDMRGRAIYTNNNVNKAELSISGLQTAHEVIIVEVNTVKGKVSKKVVY